MVSHIPLHFQLDEKVQISNDHWKQKNCCISYLKLTFRKYPAIHTNYITFHSTTLQYNMTQYLCRNEILNRKNNEFNSAAMFPVWHELSRLRCRQINVADIRRWQET